jgi:hypothetical protein
MTVGGLSRSRNGPACLVLAALCACGSQGSVAAGGAPAGADASTPPAPSSGPDAASEAGSAAPADAGAGSVSDAATGGASDTGSDAAADAAGPPPLNPVSLCPVDTMDQIYAGPLPPNPYGPLPPATPCIAAPHDVIVVLGCPNNADGTPSTCQTTRADLATQWMKAGLGSRFITSGGAAHNQYVEAVTLRDLLVARGVPSSSIWMDTQALHTDQNIYFSTQIMKAQGWTNAIVISDDPGQFLYTGLCDSNCCVDLGRLTVFQFTVEGAVQKQGHYVLYPWAQTVSTAECTLIEQTTKSMCTNLSSRTACADQLLVDAGDQ